MRGNEFLDKMELVNPKYVEAANKAMVKKKKPWIKCGAAVACFALVIAIGFSFTKDLFISPDHKDITDTAIMIEYDNAYLEIIEEYKTVNKFGLKKEITDEVIGKHITFLQKKDTDTQRGDYVIADKETDFELLEYAPAPHKAVRVFRNNDKYYYAWFCNYLIGQNESMTIQKAFDVFGIDKASDIISITPIKTDNTMKANGAAITNSAVITEFYTEISKLTAHSFDEYHEAVFADELENYEDKGGGDVGSELYTRVADDFKKLKIETKDGLYFVIGYYPSYYWIEVGVTMSYYQMTPKIQDWFEENVTTQ